MFNGFDSVKQAEKIAFISELEIIQAKISTLYEEKNLSAQNQNYYNSLGREISQVEALVLEKALQGASSEGFKYFTVQDLQQIGLDNITQEVIINLNTGQVISLSGIEIEGVIYYKLEDIPNYAGNKVIYEDKNIEASIFEVEVTELSNNWNIKLKNIQYKNNVSGGTVSYKLHENTNWILNVGTNFTVSSPGLYDIKLTDKAGNSTIIQKFIEFNYKKDGMILYLDGENFEYSTQTVWEDLSGNENNATLQNFDFNTTSGWTGKALKLDGVNDSVAIPAKIDAGSSMSIEVVFTDYDHTKNDIIYSDNSWKGFCAHTYNDNGNIYIGGNYVANSINRFVPTEIAYRTLLNKIFSLGYTYDTTTNVATVYINGIKKASKTYANDSEKINSFIISGANKSYSRISIYNKSLNQEEILDNYARDKIRFTIEN